MNSLGKYTDPDYLKDEVAKKKAKDDGTEVSDYAKGKDSALKRILSFGRKVIAGENAIGRVGGVVKDVAKHFVPLGGKIDSVTDSIGDSLKTKPKDRGNMNWIKNRLKERTTWQGIIAVLTALGVSLSPDQKEALITAGAAIVTAIWVFTKEPQSEDAKK